MPRARTRSLFELGGQWIAEEPGRPGLYRFWTDPGSGRTRRASLGTANLERAKAALAAIVVNGAPKDKGTLLATVLEAYFTERSDLLPSGKPARHAGRLMLQCWGEKVKVGEIDERRQKAFVDWSLERGHSLGYISRNLSVLAAAAKFAKLDLAVIVKEGSLQAKWPVDAKAARRAFVPTDEQLARALRVAAALPQYASLYRWMLNAMATGGRPEAVLDLMPAARQRETGLIDLNPPGRAQNKKFRPIVRTPEVMAGWLDEWEAEMLSEARKAKPDAELDAIAGRRYCAYTSVASVKTALHRLRAEEGVELPLLSRYSFRHKVTTVLRADKVPVEQIAYQLGHKRSEESTTRLYGEYDPGYLAEACASLDAWIRRVLRLAKQKPKVRRAA